MEDVLPDGLPISRLHFPPSSVNVSIHSGLLGVSTAWASSDSWIVFLCICAPVQQECEYDSVDVSSRVRDVTVKKHGVFCGTQKPPSVTSEGNVLRVGAPSDIAELVDEHLPRDCTRTDDIYMEGAFVTADREFGGED